ncbi:MAG: hypothetical protein ACC645_02700 [Pirellulales bacterium]
MLALVYAARRSLSWIVLILFCCTGAQCRQTTWPLLPGYSKGAPRLLPDGPTKDQVIQVVNANTDRVRFYKTNNASISISGLASLKTSIAMEKPRRFRLKAGTALTGTEVDLGSNDQLFWMWVRRGEPRQLYYCHHDRYAASEAARSIPMEPKWFIEALGLIRFDPRDWHAGPYARHGGNLEIRSRSATPAGDIVRITVVDPVYGWVLEQHVMTATGVHLASVVASGHRYDAEVGVSLPSRVEIQMPPAQLSIKIDVGDVILNRPVGDPATMWAKPSYPGFQEVDLARARGRVVWPQPAARREDSPQAPKVSWWKQLLPR